MYPFYIKGALFLRSSDFAIAEFAGKNLVFIDLANTI